MRSYNYGRFQQQASFLRRQYLQEGDLPFTDVLSDGIISQAVTAINVAWHDRIYSPLVTLLIATTLLDADEFTKDDLAQLYRARWNAELDLRSLKQTLQMDMLRCKSPELVRKEIWTHILAYNLIRTIMAQAATKHGVEPRTISFKGAIQTLEAFQPVIAIQGQRDAALRQRLYEQLLDAVAVHRVADRPGRFEPRRRKQPHRKHEYLNVPRHELKRLMAKGFREI